MESSSNFEEVSCPAWQSYLLCDISRDFIIVILVYHSVLPLYLMTMRNVFILMCILSLFVLWNPIILQKRFCSWEVYFLLVCNSIKLSTMDIEKASTVTTLSNFVMNVSLQAYPSFLSFYSCIPFIFLKMKEIIVPVKSHIYTAILCNIIQYLFIFKNRQFIYL